MHRPLSASYVFDQLFGQEVHEEAVVPGPVGAALVAAHHADGRKPTLVYARRPAVLSAAGSMTYAVVALVEEEVTGERADGVGADPPAVHRGIDEDVDARMAVVGVASACDWIQPTVRPSTSITYRHAGLVEVFLDRGDQVVAAPPPLVDLGRRADPDQLPDVVPGPRPQPHQGPMQHVVGPFTGRPPPGPGGEL